MATFAKPENALKRAEELIAVGQKSTALQVLHDVLTSKKHRTWQKPLETLMQRYIGLCVEMRRGKFAKDGLHQYKGICQAQAVNMASLENIIKYFLDQSEEHAKSAQAKAQASGIDIDDLEIEESAESLLLSSISGEDSKERSDREIVTPWLKFLWETYRTVLEILRNNTRLEHLYQDTAQKAFNFCLNFKRKTEFRRLSELLRNHLVNFHKTWTQVGATGPTPETLQLHIDTRFSQLNVALELELSQEAFRTIEDIHGLLTVSKRPPKPQVLINYYHKLTKLFWVSDNLLFHAYSWYKYYTLSKVHNKSLSPAELRSMASSVLLSALSIPLQAQSDDERYFDFDTQKEKNARLATLLGFNTSPKREVLIAEITSKNIGAVVLPELSDLIHLLEEKFHPLEILGALKPKLDFIQANPALQQYGRKIEKLLFLRYLQQLSKVYQTVTLAYTKKQANFITPTDFEKWTAEAVKNRLVDLRIDHQNAAIHFGSLALESQGVRNQLTNLARNLQIAAEMINPELKSDRHTKKAEVFKHIAQTVQEEHKRNLQRQVILQKRKERAELIEKAKAEEEEKKRQEEIRIKEEKARQAKAQQDKIKAAQLAEQQEKEKKAKAAENILRELAKTSKGAAKNSNVIKKIEQDIREGIPGADNATLQATILAASKKEVERKLKKAGKKLDHLERARREAERPLLEKMLEEQKQKDKGYYEEKVKKYLEEHKVAHAQQVIEKKRLARVDVYRAEFEQRIQARIEEDMKKKRAERDAIIERLREQLYREKEKRRREEEERRAEELARKLAQEEERRIRQAEEERARAEEEAKKREEQERLSKLNERAELQRKREEEALRKRAEEEEALRKRRIEERSIADKADSWRRTPAQAPAPAASAPSAAAEEDSWRKRREEAAAPSRDRDRREPAPSRERDFASLRDREREPPKEERSWRSAPRDEPPRRERDEPPRREREEPSRRSDEASTWRRGPAAGSAPPEKEERSWRDRGSEDRGGRDSRDDRRGGDRDRRDDRGGRRDDRDRRDDRNDRDRRDDRRPGFGRGDSERGGDNWRRGGASSTSEASSEESTTTSSDGFQTVKRGGRRA